MDEMITHSIAKLHPFGGYHPYMNEDYIKACIRLLKSFEAMQDQAAMWGMEGILRDHFDQNICAASNMSKVYNKIKYAKCSICLELLDVDSENAWTTTCKHSFHMTCLATWE